MALVVKAVARREMAQLQMVLHPMQPQIQVAVAVAVAFLPGQVETVALV